MKLTTDEGLLPMHLAAISGTSAGIRTLLGFGLSTIFARENTEAMLPLDFAVDGFMGVMNDDDDNMLQNEFRQCIDILLMSALYDRPILGEGDDDTPFLPIHGTASAQPCERAWKQLMVMYGEEYGGAIDPNGKTALHTLMSSMLFQEDLVADAISSINSAHPFCLSHVDNSGFAPLHTALVNKMPYIVVEKLVECNGASVSVPVSEDVINVSLQGMLPFQLAASSGCEVDVIYFLLRSAPDNALALCK